MSQRSDTRPRTKKGRLRKLATIFGALALMVMLNEEGGNKCCPSCPGCGNNWVCTEEILNALRGCCGTGSGTATCQGSTFCVKCNTGATCGC